MPKPNADLTSKPNKTQQPDPTLVSVADAAERLGVTSDAVRMRLKRGVLTGEKRGGRLFVQLPDPTGNQTANPTSNQTTDPTKTQRLSNVDLRAVIDSKNETIAAMTLDLAYLRDQLAARSRELASANERADVLHRIALNRIESLSAVLVERAADDQTEPDSPQTRHDAPGGPIAQRLSNESSVESGASEKRGFARWLAALFGR